MFGFRLIAVVRNHQHHEDLMALGAWAVVDTSKTSLLETMMELTHGIGATVGIGSIGGEDGHTLIRCIRPEGMDRGSFPHTMAPNILQCVLIGE